MATFDSKAGFEKSAEPPGSTHEAMPQSERMARLYREHNQALIRFLMTRLESEQEARDVAQEAYVRMLQLDSQGAVSFLSGYLFKTAANIAVDRLRHRTTRRRVDQGMRADASHGITQPAVATPEQVLQARERIEQIERAVRELPEKCRQAFYLHRLHDMSPPDIAAALGVTKRTVHHYLARALEHLYARVEGIDNHGEDAP